jgi:hypothetical protein
MRIMADCLAQGIDVVDANHKGLMKIYIIPSAFGMQLRITSLNGLIYYLQLLHVSEGTLSR